MLALVQRVTHAQVAINNKSTAAIEQGLVALCGFKAEDTEQKLNKLLHKLFHYRIFSDEQGKMNHSVTDINGAVLFVPQFTLVADTSRGLRPSFSKGAPPLLGSKLFDHLKSIASNSYPNVAFGNFGADMQITLCNDGPVTFLLEN